MPDHARAFAFLRSFAAACADEVQPLPPYGHVLHAPELPAARGLNQLTLIGPHPDLTAEDVASLTVDVLPRVPEPQVVVEDEETGARLEGALIRAGWTVERALLMALGDAPGGPVDTSCVREGSQDEVLPLMTQWYEEDLADATPEVLRQLTEYARREMEAMPARYLVADRGQGPVGSCRLRVREGVAQVEDVFVTPGVRGRGTGGALVGRAAALARSDGHDLTFIVADADGRAHRLYERLGFVPGPTFRTFWRRVRAA